LHEALLQSEKDQVFIIANFNQVFFSGTLGGGHFAPIGAYDAEKKRVLIMDPDREFFEPYWVSEQLLLKSMATRDDETQVYRGYMIIKYDLDGANKGAATTKEGTALLKQ
jgi:hypothetical protein